jgi:murein DD-endopeptidase MepM/ murein hydrolase activator NlpD
VRRTVTLKYNWRITVLHTRTIRTARGAWRAACLAAGLAAAVAVVLTVPVTGARADSDGDKARVDAQLAQTQATLEAATGRAQQAATAYTSATAALTGAQATLADAQGRVVAAEVAARQANREAGAARGVFDAASAAFDTATAEVNRGRDEVGAFVAAAYRGAGLVALNAVLTARSPTEVADRVENLNQIAANRKRALDTLTRARWTARDRQNDAQLAHDAAEAARAAAARALSDSVAAQTAARQAATAVQDLVRQRQQALATANQERAAVLARYNALRAESARIAAELRARGARSGSARVRVPDPRPGAYFLMPVQGWKSSDFGMRYDPFYHVWQLHAGVDVAAGGGQPIHAAADGEVVHAGWSGGNGNYTCVSHGTYQGRNLATCYGHQSKLLVSVGQWVHRGDVIGRVGTTGASTGYHMHFEVRLDGTPVNPLRWLPGCLC